MASHDDRISPMGFIATNHVIKRIKTRMGVPKRAVMRAMEKAYEQGQRSGDFKGQFRIYLDEIKANDGPANEVIVHNGFVFLICIEPNERERILTGWVIPNEHKQRGV